MDQEEQVGLLEHTGDPPAKRGGKSLHKALRIQLVRSYLHHPFTAFWLLLVAVLLLFAVGNSVGTNLLHSKGFFAVQTSIPLSLPPSRPEPKSLVQHLETLMQRNRATDEEIEFIELAEHYTSLIQTKSEQVSGIETSRIDHKKYKYLELGNKLKILIIEDPHSPKAQAALNVHAGSWQDPSDYLGLAHFLEHMLFQGNGKYPAMGQFGEVVSKYGGSTNAYTSSVKTNYYFSVAQAGFLETLDIFAHFFIDPLLSHEAVYKEVNAVNSEYEIDVSEDGWKFFHLLTLLCDKQHPMSRFTIGNHDSLRKDGVVQALRKYFDTHYSANLMALVVKSAIPIERMESWLQGSDFTLILDKQLKKPTYTHLKGPINRLNTVTKFRLNSAANSVIYVFQFDKGNDQYYRSKPLGLLIALIRSTHKDGLQDYLKVNNLSLRLYSSTFLDSNSAFTLLVLEFVLVDHVSARNNRIVFQLGQVIFSYFELLNTKLFYPDGSPTTYYQQFFSERSSMSKVEFSFMEDATLDIFKVSNSLNTYPVDEVFSATMMIKESRPDLVKYYITELRNPANLFILVGDDEFQYVTPQDIPWTLAQVGHDDSDVGFISTLTISQRSALYRLDYESRQLSQQTLQQLSQGLGADLAVPDINGFIPQDLKMKSLCSATNTALVEVEQVPLFEGDCRRNELKFESFLKYPMLLKHDLEGRVYWRLERSFEVPAVFVGIRFQTPYLAQDGRKAVMLNLFNGYMEQCLGQKLFQAVQAGYRYELNSDQRGFSIVFYGWSDKFAQVFQTAIRELHTQTREDASLSALEQQRFDREKITLQNALSNIQQKRMYQVLLSHTLPYFMVSDYVAPATQISELQRIDAASFETFKSRFLRNYRFTSFFTGNIFKEEAEQLVAYLRSNDRSNRVELAKRNFQVVSTRGRSIVVPMVSESADPLDTNGVTMNYYLIGYREEKTRAVVELIRTKFRSEAYEYLRTQKQLGYVVFAQFSPIGCQEGVYVLVQGNAEPPYRVNQHIDDFLERFEAYLRGLSLAEFGALKQGAVSSLKSKLKSMKEQAEYFWSEIRFGTMEFDAPEVSASIIEQLTIEDVIEFFVSTFRGPESGKLSLQIYGYPFSHIPSKGMVSQTLGIQPYQLVEEVRSNRLLERNSYAHRDEEVLSSQQEFTSRVTKRLYCSHKIGNA